MVRHSCDFFACFIAIVNHMYYYYSIDISSRDTAIGTGVARFLHDMYNFCQAKFRYRDRKSHSLTAPE